MASTSNGVLRLAEDLRRIGGVSLQELHFAGGDRIDIEAHPVGLGAKSASVMVASKAARNACNRSEGIPRGPASGRPSKSCLNRTSSTAHSSSVLAQSKTLGIGAELLGFLGSHLDHELQAAARHIVRKLRLDRGSVEWAHPVHLAPVHRKIELARARIARDDANPWWDAGTSSPPKIVS